MNNCCHDGITTENALFKRLALFLCIKHEMHRHHNMFWKRNSKIESGSNYPSCTKILF